MMSMEVVLPEITLRPPASHPLLLVKAMSVRCMDDGDVNDDGKTARSAVSVQPDSVTSDMLKWAPPLLLPGTGSKLTAVPRPSVHARVTSPSLLPSMLTFGLEKFTAWVNW